MTIIKLEAKNGRPTKYSSKTSTCVTAYTKSCIKNDEFPTIEGLAVKLGVVSKTIYTWEKEYEEFLQTTEALRDVQRSLLIKNGLNGKYSTSFSIFLLKSMHGFSDSKPLYEAVQNNYMNISPEILADALELMKQEDK
jgi:hypothetical protein